MHLPLDKASPDRLDCDVITAGVPQEPRGTLRSTSYHGMPHTLQQTAQQQNAYLGPQCQDSQGHGPYLQPDLTCRSTSTYPWQTQRVRALQKARITSPVHPSPFLHRNPRRFLVPLEEALFCEDDEGLLCVRKTPGAIGCDPLLGWATPKVLAPAVYS